MSEQKAPVRPVILEVERVKHMLAGSVQSRSDPERVYQPRLLLEVDGFCTCPSMTLRNNPCEHLKALYRELSIAELRRWIRDGITVRQDEET